jgi:ArsR family transcriptional regulator
MDVVACYKALGDPTRYAIFKDLKEKDLCACHLLEKLDITQPTLSFHMKKLTECGLVLATKDGIWTRYQINREVIGSLMSELEYFAL